MSISAEQYKRESTELQMFLSEIAELLERESGFVQRKSLLGGKELVQIMSLGSLENGKASLDQFVQVAMDLGVKISGSGLHQRLTLEAVELLAQICQMWMQQNQNQSLRPVLAGFGAVRIVDSNQISLAPQLREQFRASRHGAALKVQLAYDYRSGRIEALVEQRRRKAKQNAKVRGKTISQQALAYLDWAFFISNVPLDLLTLEQIATVYRVRW